MMRRSGYLVHRCPQGIGHGGLGGHSPPCKVTRGAVLPLARPEGRLSARALRPAASSRRGWRRGPGPGAAQRQRRRGCAACTASAALWLGRRRRKRRREGGRETETEREAGERALRGSAANFASAAQQEQPPIPRCVTPAPGEYGKTLPSMTPLSSSSSSSPGLLRSQVSSVPHTPELCEHRSSRPSQAAPTPCPAAEGLRHCSPSHTGTAGIPGQLPETMGKLQRTLDVLLQ